MSRWIVFLPLIYCKLMTIKKCLVNLLSVIVDFYLIVGTQWVPHKCWLLDVRLLGSRSYRFLSPFLRALLMKSKTESKAQCQTTYNFNHWFYRSQSQIIYSQRTNKALISHEITRYIFFTIHKIFISRIPPKECLIPPPISFFYDIA